MSYFYNRGIKDRIQKKAKSTGLYPKYRIPILFNKLVSNPRWVVEHTFGSMKHWFGSGKALQRISSCVHA
ncbi:MAG: hypothetical protein ACMUEL_08040 [Flavobacteriales bacterium Tduv]